MVLYNTPAFWLMCGTAHYSTALMDERANVRYRISKSSAVPHIGQF
jgi:hypothetical protein